MGESIEGRVVVDKIITDCKIFKNCNFKGELVNFLMESAVVDSRSSGLRLFTYVGEKETIYFLTKMGITSFNSYIAYRELCIGGSPCMVEILDKDGT